jgi:hypothetical protein
MNPRCYANYDGEQCNKDSRPLIRSDPLSGAGTITDHVYTKTPNVAKVVSPTSWNTSVIAGASPTISPPLFNVLLRGSGDVLAKERFK